MRARLQSGPPWGAAFGAAWFLANGGAVTVPPGRLEWLLRGDWMSNLFGWQFFRQSEWGWPLGRVDALLHPVGTTIGYADSIPLLALPLRLVSGVLPEDFQYFGLWLLACFALSGYFGARIAQTATDSRLIQALCGALFALSPALLGRVGHMALCAHWLILWVFDSYLRVEVRPVRSTVASLLGAVTVAACVHPYLAAMVVALALATCVRLFWPKRHVSPGALAALAASILGVTGTLAVAQGYVGHLRHAPASGFDAYTAELLSLLNPLGASNLLPGLARGGGQYEGAAYLGLGAALLAVAASVVALRGLRGRTPSGLRAWAPLLVAVGAMGIFAFGSAWTVGGKRVVGLRGVFAQVPSITSTFRAPGRFIWPLHYLVVAAAVLAWTRQPERRRHLVAGGLVAAVGLQFAELRAEPKFPHGDVETDVAVFGPHVQGARRLVLVPPHMEAGGGRGCVEEGAFDRRDLAVLSLVALRQGLTINSGYVARVDDQKAAAHCRAVAAQLQAREIPPDAVWVFGGRASADDDLEGLFCERVAGYALCRAPTGR